MQADIAHFIRSINLWNMFSNTQTFAVKSAMQTQLLYKNERNTLPHHTQHVVMYHWIKCMRCNWTPPEYMSLLFRSYFPFSNSATYIQCVKSRPAYTIEIFPLYCSSQRWYINRENVILAPKHMIFRRCFHRFLSSTSEMKEVVIYFRYKFSYRWAHNKMTALVNRIREKAVMQYGSHF